MANSRLRLVAFGFAGALILAVSCHAQLTAFTFYGDSMNDRFGASVSGAGDINGDGFDDFVVGIPADDSHGFDSGSIRVFSGENGSLLLELDGASAGDQFGTAVSDAGDINGDGFADFAVGAPSEDSVGTDSGSVYIFSGTDGSILFKFNGNSAGDLFGFTVSNADDVDEDGFNDLLVGAPGDGDNGNYSGSVRLYSGKTGQVLFAAVGDSAGDRFGFSMGGAGDVNGDGVPDVIVGSYGDDNNALNSGNARVFSGVDGSILYSIDGSAPASSFGYSVSGAGDVNGDGFDDFVVGALEGDLNSGLGDGSASIFSGVDGSVLYSFIGLLPLDIFGSAVSGAGDVNGDGFDDVLIAAQSADSNGPDSGSVQVVSGIDGSTMALLTGDSAFDLFGSSVSAAGDLNGDGFDDFIVGASRDGVNTGSAWVFGAENLPVLNYDSEQGDIKLSQQWSADGGDPQSLTGTITVSGASPGGLGIYGVSLAPTDFLYLGFPLLIANDPVNLIDVGFLGYDNLGELVIPGVSRQNAFLAGSLLYIQFFESSPTIAASNGLRLLIAP